MISSQVKMEDKELLKLYNKGERDFSDHIFYNGNIEFFYMFFNRPVHSHQAPPNFSNENLTKIILNNSKLDTSELHRANLSGTNLSGASLIDVNFSYANFSGANLNCANLSSAILIDADLSDANLS
ncbi:MAG: pentapeptide repeat-containing protein, partial [Dolichospermum sp.]